VHDPALDVGAVLGRHAAGLTAEQRRAARDLAACRTARLGGVTLACPNCGAVEYRYRSCGNRHCPKRRGGRRARWLEREAGYLLPVGYYHLVFTLPRALAALARANPRVIYNLLFAAASASVRELAAEPKHLGAQVGLVAVLHTWGQTLSLHPHLHVVATGGGLSCDRAGRLDEAPSWRGCRPGFFLPVRPLSRLFRGKYLAGLQAACARGKLRLTGRQAFLAEPAAWARWLGELYRHDWVVYSQPPCAGPAVALKYLARYAYRVALSNRRLLRVTDEAVTFSYKDYRQKGKVKEMTLPAAEFARRFLQHVLPRGLVRVRHYGLLANRGGERKLALCRRLLQAEGQRGAAREEVQPAAREHDPPGCAACGRGELRAVAVLSPWPRRPGGGSAEDSS
jgi:hypothetical protein